MHKNASVPPNKEDPAKFNFRLDFQTPSKSVRNRENRIAQQSGFMKPSSLSVLLSPTSNIRHQIKPQQPVKSKWKDSIRKHCNFSVGQEKIDEMVSQVKGLSTQVTDASKYHLNFGAITNDQQILGAQGHSRNPSNVPIKFKTMSETPTPTVRSPLPAIHFQERKNLQGFNFDQIYTTKNSELSKLKSDNKTLITGNDQLKRLNEKLMDRIDYLHSIIEKEAAASDFIYNYPPKQINMEMGQTQENLSAAANDMKKVSRENAQQSEIGKIKKKSEEKLQIQKRQYESEIKQIKKSMSEEIEMMTEIASRSCRELVQLTISNRELKLKFDMFYSKSNDYINDRDKKVTDLEKELSELHKNHSSFDKRFIEKELELKVQRKAASMLKTMNEKSAKTIQQQNGKIYLYEERFKGINVDELHSELEGLKTQVHHAQVKEKNLEHQLFKIRDSMQRTYNKYVKTKQDEIQLMALKPKSYVGPAEEFNDVEEGQVIRDREKIAEKFLVWNGDEDVEGICDSYIQFLWGSSKTTTKLLKPKILENDQKQ